MAAVYKSLSKKSGDKAEAPADGAVTKKNKSRVLILSSRGVTYRHRHLLNDLANLMPHGRKDVKFDKKNQLSQLNELCELYNTNFCLFFEARKGKDCYLHISMSPNGPTTKFLVKNIHTAEELNFPGNCLKGSRPLLSFDSAFTTEPHLQVIQALFQRVFGVPQGARKAKPFIDRVMGFSYIDGVIWVRNYEIKEGEATEEDKETEKGKGGKNITTSLVEIGPRFVLEPILIQEGSFGGPIIFENRAFVSPNQIRADMRRQKAARHNARSEKMVERLSKKGDLGLRSKDGQPAPKDELDTKALFA